MWSVHSKKAFILLVAAVVPCVAEAAEKIELPSRHPYAVFRQLSGDYPPGDAAAQANLVEYLRSILIKLYPEDAKLIADLDITVLNEREFRCEIGPYSKELASGKRKLTWALGLSGEALSKFPSEDVLAWFLGHEWAHVKQYRDYGPWNPVDMQKYEYDSDAVPIKRMGRAGWNPRAVYRFFKTDVGLEIFRYASSFVRGAKASHPNYEPRIVSIGVSTDLAVEGKEIRDESHSIPTEYRKYIGVASAEPTPAPPPTDWTLSAYESDPVVRSLRERLLNGSRQASKATRESIDSFFQDLEILLSHASKPGTLRSKNISDWASQVLFHFYRNVSRLQGAERKELLPYAQRLAEATIAKNKRSFPVFETVRLPRNIAMWEPAAPDPRRYHDLAPTEAGATAEAYHHVVKPYVRALNLLAHGNLQSDGTFLDLELLDGLNDQQVLLLREHLAAMRTALHAEMGQESIESLGALDSYRTLVRAREQSPPNSLVARMFPPDPMDAELMGKPYVKWFEVYRNLTTPWTDVPAHDFSSLSDSEFLTIIRGLGVKNEHDIKAPTDERRNIYFGIRDPEDSAARLVEDLLRSRLARWEGAAVSDSERRATTSTSDFQAALYRFPDLAGKWKAMLLKRLGDRSRLGFEELRAAWRELADFTINDETEEIFDELLERSRKNPKQRGELIAQAIDEGLTHRPEISSGESRKYIREHYLSTLTGKSGLRPERLEILKWFEKIVQAHPKWTEAMREQLIVAVHEKYHLDRVLLENLFQVSIRARPKFDMGYGTTKAPAVRSAKIASAGREAKVRAMEFYPPTKEQALRLLNDPDQWIQRLAGVPRNERISIHKAVFGDVTPAPYTIYDLNRSEPLQRAIWKAVQPKSDREVIELWGKLAAKGTTEFTDGLFDKEVLPRLERSPHFAEQAERFLDERLVWDMTIREKLWNLWYERSPLLRDLKGSGIGKRDAALQKLRRHVVDAFPEVTPTRAAVVERLSNEIRTNATEAERMEHWKTSGGVSGYAVRVLNAIIDSAKTAPNDTKLMLLKYLRGDDMNRADTINYFNTRTVDLSGGLSSSSALYEKMKNLKLGSLIEDMGYERLQRAWSTIDPRAQAVIATPLLVGPDGILATPTGRQGFTREMVPTRSNAHAMEIREAIVDYMQALVNTGRDYRESTAQAFIFFQSKPAANRTLGDMIAAICEAEGPIGIALGQRLANLELFDPESNARLHALKERVKLMTRHEKYQYLKGFEYELNGENILLPEPLGGASMKEVGEIQTSSTETEAVGMLRKGAATLISQNGATLREFLKLRAQKKPEVYGHLVPVLDNVIKKKGAEADGKREEISARVSTELVKRQQPRSQWRLEAVDVKHDRIGDREILRMPVVRGERFAALPPEIQAEVAQELINVYAPEFLGEGGLVEGYVITEADIHDGNIIVDRKNKRIFLFDRSQMEAVPKQEVRQYLDLLTTVGARRKFDNKLVTQQIVRSIGNVSRQAVPNELASDIDQYFAKPYEGELTGRKVVADLLAVQRLAGTRGVYLSDGFQDWLNMGQNLAWLEKKVPAGRPFNTRMETALTQRGLQLYTGGGVETVSGPAPQCLGVRSLARHLNIKTDE